MNDGGRFSPIGSGSPEQPAFSARIERLADVSAFFFALNGYLAQHCRNVALSQRGSVVIEELVLNAFWHGAAEGSGGVGVELEIAPPGLRGSVLHDGAAFDLVAALTAQPDDAADLSDLRSSGRGLRIVQALTASLADCRSGDTNCVRFEIAAP